MKDLVIEAVLPLSLGLVLYPQTLGMGFIVLKFSLLFLYTFSELCAEEKIPSLDS
jgi:hypothetical protein